MKQSVIGRKLKRGKEAELPYDIKLVKIQKQQKLCCAERYVYTVSHGL